MCGTLLLMCLLLSCAPFSSCEVEDDFPNEIPKISSGSCLAAGLCCKGRDSSCVVQRAPPNSIVEELDDIPCYCDHGCVLLQDCCHDFKHACGVQDCEVSNWGPWSSCDTDCGQGTMTRSRSVTRESRNGGTACPSMIQNRGYIAVLLPIEFRNKRKVNESSDITKNLRSRYPKDPEKENSFPYCVEFQVIRYTRACKSLQSFTTFREGSRVCVFCEEEAQKSYTGYRCSGTGASNGVSTRFSSIREPACHGKWRHVALTRSDDKTGACSSRCDEESSFIFV
ncbi:Somatomedin-B and thrombospondin type-1 domain-containing protein [Folsomia candida]|uniref:Somatomedin-B and thrombospondin type-1 domain-containing protein n=1 Tax=Folsomia candida TaxID=158441 RepID=A0A226F0N7_FOLCA|nr:Somatomedin-B and thrombospondin type-1 domain-containing protein [Folsomia candida]